MFHTALISSHRCSDDGNNTKFTTIDIRSNYIIFLLILARRLPVGPTALPTSRAPVTGDPRIIRRAKEWKPLKSKTKVEEGKKAEKPKSIQL